jgi:mRNA interferase RelE/StbE
MGREMPYKIEFTRAALRGLEAVPESERKKIGKKIDSLAEKPRPPGARKLSGVEGQYRIRVGDYRVIYGIDDSLVIVLVIRIGNRRDVYR